MEVRVGSRGCGAVRARNHYYARPRPRGSEARRPERRDGRGRLDIPHLWRHRIYRPARDRRGGAGRVAAGPGGPEPREGWPRSGRPSAWRLGSSVRTTQNGWRRRSRTWRSSLHCAGPFSRTWRPMYDACLGTGTHYLDITGEIDVFEALAARDRAARDAGIMLLPGVGFDVVPSDCLIADLAARHPGGTPREAGPRGQNPRVARDGPFHPRERRQPSDPPGGGGLRGSAPANSDTSSISERRRPPPWSAPWATSRRPGGRRASRTSRATGRRTATSGAQSGSAAGSDGFSRDAWRSVSSTAHRPPAGRAERRATPRVPRDPRGGDRGTRRGDAPQPGSAPPIRTDSRRPSRSPSRRARWREMSRSASKRPRRPTAPTCCGPSTGSGGSCWTINSRRQNPAAAPRPVQRSAGNRPGRGATRRTSRVAQEPRGGRGDTQTCFPPVVVGRQLLYI